MAKEPLYFEHHVFCCLNERKPDHKRGSCIGRGAQPLFNYFKSRLKEMGFNGRVNKAGCLDRCEYGPLFVIYPEGVWYRYDTREDIDEIIEQHFKQGCIVERLRVRHDQT